MRGWLAGGTVVCVQEAGCDTLQNLLECHTVLQKCHRLPTTPLGAIVLLYTSRTLTDTAGSLPLRAQVLGDV